MVDKANRLERPAGYREGHPDWYRGILHFYLALDFQELFY